MCVLVRCADEQPSSPPTRTRLPSQIKNPMRKCNFLGSQCQSLMYMYAYIICTRMYVCMYIHTYMYVHVCMYALTLLCWHDVSDIFSYYRLFVDDLIDTLGLKLYTCISYLHTYIYIYYIIHYMYITYAYILHVDHFSITCRYPAIDKLRLEYTRRRSTCYGPSLGPTRLLKPLAILYLASPVVLAPQHASSSPVRPGLGGGW